MGADRGAPAAPVEPAEPAEPAEPVELGRAPFVGRHRERQLLLGLAAGTREGRGAIALVAGEAGIGKTRLVEELLDAEHTAGVASCTPEEQPPFHVWRRALEDAARRAGDTATAGALRAAAGVTEPAGASVSGLRDDRLETYGAARAALGTLARDAGVVIVLEDLHWVDPSTAGLLAHLQADIARLPIVLVVTFRPDEIGPDHVLAQVVARSSGATHRIDLGGLAATEIAAVAGSFAGLAPEALDGAALRIATGGNPLFARELARLLGGDLPDHVTEVLPESVRLVIARRLDRLAGPAREVVDLLACHSAEAQVAQLAGASDLDPGDVLDVLDELERVGLVHAQSTGDGWSFTHALIRQTAYDALRRSRRAQLHLACATAIEAGADPSPREVAHHLVRALPLVPSARAAAAARAAGEQALAAMAYEDAARHLADALRLHPPASIDERTELLLLLGEAAYRAGDRSTADDSFGAAVDLARTSGRADHLARAALGFGAGLGGFEVVPFDGRQVTALEDALAALPADDSPLRARLLARLSVAAASEVGVEHQRELAADAVAMARRLGDPGLLAYALGAHGDAIAGPDHVAERLAAATEMLALAARARDREMELLARRQRVVAHMELGDLASARADVDAFARVADRVGEPLYQWFVPLFRASFAGAAGDFDQAERLRALAAEIGARAGSYNAQLLTRVQGGDLALLAGDMPRVREIIGSFLVDYPEMTGDPVAMVVYAATLAACGELAEARALLEGAKASGFAVRDDSEKLSTLAYASYAVVLLGDRDAAVTLRDRLGVHRDLFVVDGIVAGVFGSVEGWIGPLSHLLGLHDEAARERRAAVAANRAAGLTHLADRIEAIGTPWAAVGPGPPALPAPATPTAATPPPPALRRRGDLWELTFAGETASIRDSKGLRDIVVLVGAPGREIAAVDLVAPPAGDGRGARVADRAVDDVLDERARAAYRARIVELQEDLDEADRHDDAGRSARAQAELDVLVAELAAATGLGGASRRTGSDVERARKAVAARIGDTLKRLDQVHPAAGRHLRHSIVTGTYCAYRPEQPLGWDIVR